MSIYCTYTLHVHAYSLIQQLRSCVHVFDCQCSALTLSLRVYDLHFMDKIYDEVAHDSEILSLTYSPEMNGQCYMMFMVVMYIAHLIT